MKLTVNRDDDFPVVERTVARAKNDLVSDAVNELVPQRKDTGLPVSAGLRPITAAEIDQILTGAS